jgi:hypothetical protein
MIDIIGMALEICLRAYPVREYTIMSTIDLHPVVLKIIISTIRYRNVDRVQSVKASQLKYHIAGIGIELKDTHLTKGNLDITI